MDKLNGKVAVVTAATRGIGYACVKALAEKGAVVYLGARNMEKAKARAEELNHAGCKVKTVYHDATEKESYGAMIEAVILAEGKIDILVNNFGTSNPEKDLDIKRTSYEEYMHTMELNLASVFLPSQAVIPHMAENGGGSIINISSVGGVCPDISQIAYGTSKAAINYLTKLIAVQCARDNIRCNAVLPGMTATEAVEKHLSTHSGKYAKNFVSLLLFHPCSVTCFAVHRIYAVSASGMSSPVVWILPDTLRAIPISAIKNMMDVPP